MALSWNEIKDRALKFSNEWIDETRERAEKDSFWNDFFEVFGISRRRVATFEEPVKKLGDKQGFIDLFWKGTLLVEHKSKGKNLDKAFKQATDYFPGLKEHELPKYILVSDFDRIKLFDLDEKTEHEFHISEFYKNVKLFGFIAGYQKRTFKEEDPVNIKAAELMGKLHDQLKEFGYVGHPLEVYLVRLLFVLFADDTGIFEKDIFKEFIDRKTNEDGSDLGALLAQFFQVLNSPNENRLKNLDEHLNQFPYVNGKLFEEQLPIAAFNSVMRAILLEASGLDWGKISPAIFGSLFQSVMNPEERRNLGAHYTSEKNIFKLIKPLFLDELRAEFEKVKSNSKKLKEFHHKLSTLKFLDPACGSGNFLIITYRELRQLEIDILRELYKTGETVIDISHIIWIDVDQFFGIEYDEFASRIAEVAMWLIDHQMNMRISEEFGQYFIRLPLKKSAKIINGNALRIDWNSLTESSFIDIAATQTNIIHVNEPISHYDTINIYSKGINISKGHLPVEDKKWNTKNRGKVDYILGNPPFGGAKWLNDEQRNDMRTFKEIPNVGILDYVTAWYIKAADYIQNSFVKVAFVSTNSITQGEQVGVLWNSLFEKYSVKIHFAHQTFNWSNEAKANAAVHVVIIGFASFDTKNKVLFSYDHIKGEPQSRFVKNISPYLLEGLDFAIVNRSKPLCNITGLKTGNKPVDGGHYIFTETEKNEFIKNEPLSVNYIKPFIGANEFINGNPRYILWLKNISPSDLKKMPLVLDRIKKVKEFRESSSSKPTQKLALTPTKFHTENYPENNFLIIPQVSSERRKYIPIDFEQSGIICSDKLRILNPATLYEFGILVSIMHMSWMRIVTGRLKSDYQYSVLTVYNNYPWPKEPSEKNKNKVEEKAQKVLDVRYEFPESSLADLYDPLTMPPKLVKAHQELDKAVDLCYRPQVFTTENARIEFLFDLYNEYTSPMFKKN
ncbi:MAG: class I SAM-dependent DNA methyltransferase [Prolixibacteraceae bacterium]|jgi:type I restriction-modification system DNA methylase subunit|nr:class I SAM-dependent DNA methyltransferase [Prolixibacteraceae bacterium]MBT6004113.1 class I SAM-dependent DNA methyltransferase [Prolixibacteraceae bacterium]MBT6998901.1 class I SAM-dependent DNA methyltransferase [Prolixibacteraceae bacterium]MBT7395181.1 class I SAM-dependent DNA methyltransferase [Prolixibacteraceae bacterium]